MEQVRNLLDCILELLVFFVCLPYGLTGSSCLTKVNTISFVSTYFFFLNFFITFQERSDGPSEECSVPLGPVPEPESPLSSKEAGQPSPVSVLEVTFSEDLSSSSECFERVSADLQGE